MSCTTEWTWQRSDFEATLLFRAEKDLACSVLSPCKEEPVASEKLEERTRYLSTGGLFGQWYQLARDTEFRPITPLGSYFPMPAFVCVWGGDYSRAGAIQEWKFFQSWRFISDTSLDRIDSKLTLFKTGKQTRGLKCTRWSQRKVNRGRDLVFRCWCGEWGGELIEMELLKGKKYSTHCTVHNNLNEDKSSLEQSCTRWCHRPLSIDIHWASSGFFEIVQGHCLSTLFHQWPWRNIADHVVKDIALFW